MDVVAKSRSFAAERHASQTRKYSHEPYTVHLDNVVALLKQNGVEDATTLATGYLHDTVEDTDTQIQDLIKEFGEPIAELVYWLSDMEKGNRTSRVLMSAWRLAKAPLRAKLVKCADIIDNSTNILQHDPGFAPIFISEKRIILHHMAMAEGPILLDTPLFQEARRTTAIPPPQA
jgi:(p)ppGpp synthase/HD superfamily hydrolase